MFFSSIKTHFIFDLIASKGYLAVDFFFILSGFILTHSYLSAIRDESFSYKDFMIRRLARVYPVHLFTLLLTTLLFWIWYWTDNPLHVNALSLGDFVQNLFLVHGWGGTRIMSYNQFSWSVSAEFFIYLLFPFLLRFCLKFSASHILLLSYLAFGAIWMATVSHLLVSPIQLGAFGLFRIFPEFLIGISLYLFALEFCMTVKRGQAAIVCFMLFIAGIYLKCEDYFIIPIFSFIILLAAEESRSGKASFLSKDTAVYLGKASYALYMVHFPAFFLIFGIIMQNTLNLEKDGVPTMILWAFAPLLVTLCAVAVYHAIEVPSRKWIIYHFCKKDRLAASHIIY